MINTSFYKLLKQVDLDNQFLSACSKNDIELVQYLSYNNSDNITISQNVINSAFIKMCESGNLSLISFLLTSPNLKYRANIHHENDIGLTFSCQNGHLEVVKYLLTSPELNEHCSHDIDFWTLLYPCQNGYIDIVKFLFSEILVNVEEKIQSCKERALYQACNRGHLNIIEFIANEYPEDKTLEKNIVVFFNAACRNGHIHIVDYLLNNGLSYQDCYKGILVCCENDHIDLFIYVTEKSPIASQIDIHWTNDLILITSYLSEYNNIMNYLIFDKKIPKTNYLSNEIKINKWVELEKLFNKRVLKENLENQLGYSQLKNKIKKV